MEQSILKANNFHEESKEHNVEVYPDSPRLAETNRFISNNASLQIGKNMESVQTLAKDGSLRNTTALFEYAN